MSFAYQGGSFYALGSAQVHSRRLAILPANAWLTEINVDGNVFLPYNATNFTAGVFPTFNLVAGLQWVTSGNAAYVITNGTPGSAQWLTFAEGLPSNFLLNDVPGTSPVNVVERTSYALQFRWRGTKNFQAAQDVYLSIGMDTGQPVATAFEAFYSYYVGYTT